jgi:hypothetical protein
LYRSPSEPIGESIRRDNFLQTPVSERDFAGAPYPQPGVRVRGTGSNPPWLVVVHYIDRMGVSRWPVRLWRVTDIEAAPPGSQVSDWYTRAISVRIVEELPAWLLFGDHGYEATRVIDAAGRLEDEDVTVLAAARADAAGHVYAEAWRRWQAQARSGSPVGCALILVHQAVDRSARRSEPSLFRYDPVDGVDVLADRTWVAAKAACLEAALGLGAPHLVAPAEQALLTQAWRRWLAAS